MIFEAVVAALHRISWKSGIASPRESPNAAMLRGEYRFAAVIQMMEIVAMANGHNHDGRRARSRSRISRQAIVPPRKQGTNLRIRNQSPRPGWIKAATTEM